MIKNSPDILTGCTKEVLSFVEWIETWGKSNNMGELIISSGFRSEAKNKAAGGSVHSAHLKGQAVDFSFTGINVFKIVSTLYGYWLSGAGAWAHSTDFEVCRGKGKQHIHIGFVPEKEKVSYTGVYLA